MSLIFLGINWMIICLLGVLLGCLYCFHRITRTIQVEGLEKIKPYQRGVILVGNHPSLFITGLSPLFLFPIFLVKPRLIPWVTPRYGWYHKWWFTLFRIISIPVDKSDGSEFKRAVTASRFIKALKKGRIIICFAEGTRTFKAAAAGNVVYSKNGQMMGVLEGGAALVAIASGAAIIPFWSYEKYERLPMPWDFPIKIRIGDPLFFGRETSTEEATQQLTKALLALADQQGEKNGA